MATLWKVYQGKELVGQLKHAEDAAMIANATPDSVVRWATQGLSVIVWREGKEVFSAGESYDGAAKIMWERRDAYRKESRDRYEESVRKERERLAQLPREAILRDD